MHRWIRQLIGHVALALALVPATAAAQGGTGGDDAREGAAATAPTVWFSDGFESGDFGQWSGRAGMLAQQRAVEAGLYAARATSSGEPAFARATLATPQSALFYRLRFNVLAQGAQPVKLMGVRSVSDGAGAPLVALEVSAAGYLVLQNAVTDTLADSAVAVERGVWHELQLFVRTGLPSAEVMVWYDGRQMLALTPQLGADPIGRIDIGDDETGRSYDVAFDAVIVAPTQIAPEQPTAPVPIRIETVPPLPNVQFRLDEQVAISDHEGVARFEVETIEDLAKRLTLPESQLTPDTRATLGRWFWDRNTRVRAALDLSHPVAFGFENLQGQALNAEPISEIVLKSSHGEVHTLRQAQLRAPIWLQGSRMVPTHEGLLQKDIYYAVQRVVIHGTNVVNRAQQKFYARSQRHWQLQLMFYSASFRAHDALFGTAAGSGVTLEYPDGYREALAFGPSGEVRIPQLPRGEYQVKINAPGISPYRPLALTRDQNVTLEVFSQVDIAVVGITLAVLGVGLLLVGRPWLLTLLRGGRRSDRARPADVPVGRARRAWQWGMPLGGALLVAVVVGGTLLHLGGMTAVSVAAVPDPRTRSYLAAPAPARAADVDGAAAAPGPAEAPPEATARPSSAHVATVPVGAAPTVAAAPPPRSYVVQRGDSLRKIATLIYADPEAWRRIYAANRDRLSDPQLLRPGQRLVLPDE